MIILPTVKISQEHKLSLLLQKLDGGKKTIEWAQESAEQLLSIMWIFVFLAAFVISDFSPIDTFLKCLVVEVFLRLYKIRSYLYFIPVYIWCIGLLIMFYFD